MVVPHPAKMKSPSVLIFLISAMTQVSLVCAEERATHVQEVRFQTLAWQPCMVQIFFSLPYALRLDEGYKKAFQEKANRPYANGCHDTMGLGKADWERIPWWAVRHNLKHYLPTNCACMRNYLLWWSDKWVAVWLPIGCNTNTVQISWVFEAINCDASIQSSSVVDLNWLKLNYRIVPKIDWG